MHMPGAGAALRADMCLVYARALPVYLGHLSMQFNKFLRDQKKLVYFWHTPPRTALCHCRWVFFADGTLSGIWVVYGIYH